MAAVLLGLSLSSAVAAAPTSARAICRDVDEPIHGAFLRGLRMEFRLEAETGSPVREFTRILRKKATLRTECLTAETLPGIRGMRAPWPSSDH